MNKYHEKETILLTGGREWSRKDLHVFLKSLGFKSEDDFYHIQRKDALPSWQTSTLLSVEVQSRVGEIYQTEDHVIEGSSGKWDGLLVSYFMATVPKDCIRPAVDIIFAISNKFELQALFCGRPQTLPELTQSLEAVAAELTANFDDPGSDTLVILIEQSYNK